MAGKLIVLEGVDGCGKSTQLREAGKLLRQKGKDFMTLSFPRYDKESSALIRMYLAGEFGGSPGDVNPYAASAFYAVDRVASYLTEWRDYYESGGLVLCDRYTTSNAVHQSVKLSGSKREDYFKWLAEFEYDRLGLPCPDLVVLLDLPGETILRQVGGRGMGADIHESHADYLVMCRESAVHAARHYGWKTIDCSAGGTLKPVEEIAEEICALILQLG